MGREAAITVNSDGGVPASIGGGFELSGSVPRLRRVDFNQTFTYNVIGWDIQHGCGITIGGMLMLSAESVIRPTASDEKMEEAPFSFLTNRKRRVTILW